MNTDSPKKLSILFTLDALKKYSDTEHRLTLQEIIDCIKADYGIEFERKSISRNLSLLSEFGYNIKKKGGFYLESWIFSRSELSVLINSVLYSSVIPREDTLRIIDKLYNMGSIYFSARRNTALYSASNHINAADGFLGIVETIEDAIAKGRRIAFTYNDYGVDKKLHPRRKSKYVILPHKIIIWGGRWYISGYYSKYQSVSNFRIDRITNIKLLPAHNGSPKVSASAADSDTSENLYMYTGEKEYVTILVSGSIVSDLVDWFGHSFTAVPADKNRFIVRVKVNPRSIVFWALQYSDHARVLAPKHICEKLATAAKQLTAKYSQS